MEANRLKLNAGKRELLWSKVAVDRHLTSEQGPSEPVMHVRLLSLVSQYHLTSVMRSMFLAYVRHASIGSVRFVVFDDPSTPSPQRHFVHAFIASRVDYVTPC